MKSPYIPFATELSGLQGMSLTSVMARTDQTTALLPEILKYNLQRIKFKELKIPEPFLRG